MDIQPGYSVQDVVLRQATRKVPRSKIFRNGGYGPHKRRTLESGRTRKAKRYTGWMDTLFMGMEQVGQEARLAQRKQRDAVRRESAAVKHLQASQEKADRERADRERRRERKARLEDKRWEEEVLPGKLTAGVLECFLQDY